MVGWKIIFRFTISFNTFYIDRCISYGVVYHHFFWSIKIEWIKWKGVVVLMKYLHHSYGKDYRKFFGFISIYLYKFDWIVVDTIKNT